jgi:hypothetical protein
MADTHLSGDVTTDGTVNGRDMVADGAVIDAARYALPMASTGYHVGAFGAVGDGSTDNTAAIQAAIDAANSQITTYQTPAHVVFGHGTYCATELVLKNRVILEGESVQTTELRQIAATNADFIKSENFDALTGTNKWHGTDGVPSYIGFRNIRIHGNKANQGDGNWRGLVLYAKGLYFDNCQVLHCKGDGVYTECGEDPSVSEWPTFPEGHTGLLVSALNGGTGWDMRGPHDISCVKVTTWGNGGGGLKISRVAGGYLANGDGLFIHSYANAGIGVHIKDTTFRAGIIRAEDNGQEGLFLENADNCLFGTVHLFGNGKVSGAYQLVVNQPTAFANLGSVRIRTAGRAACGGAQIAGSSITATVNIQGDVSGGGEGSGIGLDIPALAQMNNINGTISYFGAAGGVGLRMNNGGASSHNVVSLAMRDCSTMFQNVTHGVANRVQITGVCDVGDVKFDGVGPGSGPSREEWDVHIRDGAGGVAVSRQEISSPVNLNFQAGAAQTVFIPHSLMRAPDPNKCSVTLHTATANTAWRVGQLRVTQVNNTHLWVTMVLDTKAGAALTGTVRAMVEV